MDNIILANEKRENNLGNIGCIGCFLFIISGIIGCNIIEDGGSTFGWILFAIGVVLYFYTYVQKEQLKEDGGALTKRKLDEDDLRSLNKDDLERLRCHIYAKHGYNFNVNDGLYYLDKITKKIQDVWSLSHVVFNNSNLDEYCREFGCSREQLIVALESYNDFRVTPGLIKVEKNGGIWINTMSEKEKDTLRERIERQSSFVNGLGNVYIGYFNRDGIYGHEGNQYYHYKQYEWYKPITSNIEEVNRMMSDIEKYNVQFIKAHEVKCSD